MREDETITLVRACQKHRCEVFVLPRLHQVTQVNEGMDFLGDFPLIRLRRAAYRTLSWHSERVVDIVFSALALVVLSPVLAACALAVRLEGGPGVIFRQERVGCDGVRFELLKFRSMRPADEQERRPSGTSPKTTGSARSAGCSGSPRWTSCPSCSTSCGAT